MRNKQCEQSGTTCKYPVTTVYIVYVRFPTHWHTNIEQGEGINIIKSPALHNYLSSLGKEKNRKCEKKKKKVCREICVSSVYMHTINL